MSGKENVIQIKIMIKINIKINLEQILKSTHILTPVQMHSLGAQTKFVYKIHF